MKIPSDRAQIGSIQLRNMSSTAGGGLTNHQHQHHPADLHHHHNLQHLQLQQQQANNMQLHPPAPQEELNFSTFMDLCRFCSLKPGQKMSLFEKEAEHRQVLYKVRSVLPSVVNTAQPKEASRRFLLIDMPSSCRSRKTTCCPRKSATAASPDWRI